MHTITILYTIFILPITILNVLFVWGSENKPRDLCVVAGIYLLLFIISVFSV